MVDASLGSAVAAGPPKRKIGLPELRDDLELLPGPLDRDGSPTWTLYDPARGKYFRLTHQGFAFLSSWHARDPEHILTLAATVLGRPLDAKALEQMMQFVKANHLHIAQGADELASLARVAAAGKQGWFKWAMHNYLFVRIPLVRPDRFLTVTEPWVRPLFSAWFLYLSLVLGAVGLLLVARQWEQFVGTFLYFFTWEGAAFYGITLLGTKLLHELGHAYFAKRHGCRVPTMGLALMVLWPVLYTDTTDGWRLIPRRPRLEIAAGGILVELVLACLATFAWSFLPEGPLKSAAFLVATVGWVTTLVINLNPFMRFDGYYLAADGTGIANLQPRSFAMGRWALREAIFGLKEPAPEAWRRSGTVWLVLYAYATWIYRFFLFLGIALLVYHFFIKLVGILLMVVELLWFIAMPVANEIKAWWRLRDKMRWNVRPFAALLLLAGLVAFLALPWQDRLRVPAIHQAEATALVYPPFAAMVSERFAQEGDRVTEGDLLVRLEAPELSVALDLAEQELALLQYRIQRQMAAQQNLDRIAVMEGELAAILARVRGLRAAGDRLEITAAISGDVIEMDEDLQPGRWVAADTFLARLVARDRSELVAYAPVAQISRVETGAEGRFFPEDPTLPTMPVRLEQLDQVAVETLETPYFVSDLGGRIAVQPARPNEDPLDRPGFVPREGQVRLRLAPLGPEGQILPAPDQVVRGVVFLESEPRSIAGILVRGALSVLLRESGF